MSLTFSNPPYSVVLPIQEIGPKLLYFYGARHHCRMAPILLANPILSSISAQVRSGCHLKDVVGNVLNLAVYLFANSIGSFLGQQKDKVL
jgi:hypothetical protein